jgi:hypothetical protein
MCHQHVKAEAAKSEADDALTAFREAFPVNPPANVPERTWDIVFARMPSGDLRFVEIEDEHRQSVNVGEFIYRDDGFGVLRLRGDLR